MADAIVSQLPIVTRKQAKAQGLTHYFMGSSCQKGHTAQRYTRNGECIVCALDRYNWDPRVKERLIVSKDRHREKNLKRGREYARAKVAADPEGARARWRAEYAANPDAANARRKRWTEKNAEYVAERGRAYRASNEDWHIQSRARVKAWRIANPDAYIAQLHLRRSRKLGAEGSYVAEDVQRMLQVQNGLCNGCFCDISTKYTVDHMNPLSRGGSNWPINLQLLCKTCNSSKNNRTMEEWLAYKERTRQHQRRKEQI